MHLWIRFTIAFLVSNLVIILGSILLFGNFITLPQNIFITFLIVRTVVGVYVVGIFLLVLRKQMVAEKLLFLSLAGVSFFVSYFLETYSFIFLNTMNPELQSASKFLFIAAQVGITIAPLPFMYFVISFFKNEVNVIELLPVVLDIVLETIYQPMGPTIGTISFDISSQTINYWIYDPKEFWINILYFISIAYLVIYLSYLIYQSRKRTIEAVIIEQQNIFFIGIFTIFIISPIIFTANIFITVTIVRFYWIAIVGRSFVVLGMSIFIYAYYRSSKKLDFFQPQPLEALFLLDAYTGNIIYRKMFQTNIDWELLERIVSNVTIINKMLSDALGINSLITGIDFIDKELLVDTLSDLQLISILVVKNETKVIQDNYKLLLSQITPRHLIEMQKIDDLVQANFRF